MADFRTKLITLAGIATMFAGMAHAQLNNAPACTATTSAVFIASEGTNEQLADTTITCGSTAGTGASILNISVYLSPSVTITSATLGSGGSAKSETLAGIGQFGTTSATFATTAVSGSVSGSTVTFSGINIPAIAAGGSVTLTITNIKVNASTIATSSGAPTAVSETLFLGGTNVTPGVLSVNNVAFATNGLTGVKTTAVTSNNSIASVPICNGITAYINAAGGLGSDANLTANVNTSSVYPAAATGTFGQAAFNVVFGEAFATAFKNQGAATAGQALGVGTPSGGLLNTANTTIGSEFTNNTYTGFGFSANSTTNQATSGTRVMIVFNNIPANVTVYVPLTVSYTTGAITSTITLTNSATGAYSATTGTTANGSPGTETSGNSGGNSSAAALTVSNGSATAIYEVTANNPGAQETYAVPVYLAAGGAAVTAPSSAITATVSFAPIGASSNVPNFVSGSSTATANGASFSACSTTLLFPFVTNQLGFDTGIAISNTSSDLLKSATTSQAAAQSGTCSLTFFGNTAPTAAVVTPTVTAGTAYTAAASTLAPGFQGYAIASCNFLYGHGFAYVVYNLTQNNGAAMGYLADVINANRTSSVAATTAVNSSSPESAGH